MAFPENQGGWSACLQGNSVGIVAHNFHESQRTLQTWVPAGYSTAVDITAGCSEQLQKGPEALADRFNTSH